MLIQEMIEGQIKKTTTATVAVGNVNDNKDSIERQKRNNTALELMSGCERKAFLKHLIKLWMDVRTLGWSDKEKMESLIYLFGEAYGKRSPFGEQLIYTVTMSGNILRAWYGNLTFGLGGGYESSDGNGLLFLVRGEPEEIQEFIDSVLSTKVREDVVQLPNRARIYGLMSS